jgi:hypothetical protein
MRSRRWLAFVLGAAMCVACGGGGGGPRPTSDAAAGDGSSADLASDVGITDSAADAGDGAAPPTDGLTSDSGPRDGGFAPGPGVDDGGRGRRVGQEFYVVGQTLLTAGDGTGWLFWRSYADPMFTGEKVHLDRFDAGGVFVGSSALESRNPDGVVLHDDGTLTAYKHGCGPRQADICFHREALTGAVTETVWPGSSRQVTRYQVDDDGNVADHRELPFDTRRLVSAVGHGGGLYAISLHGGVVLSRLGADYAPAWATDVLPWVVPPDVPLGRPIEDVLRAAALANQFATNPVPTGDGVVVAAIVTRGTLAALAAARGIDLPRPADPRCPDVIVAHLRADGTNLRYFAVPTAACEALPKLAVVDNHAVVATVVKADKPPEPNDTYQYDIGLAIVNLATGEVRSHALALREDDWVHALAACGPGRVCLAGLTGARMVDTGSTVSNGGGFVLPVSLAGAPGSPWTLTSPRHSEILHLVPRPGGLLFFATVNGPITHTADNDRWLGFNEAMLGTIDGP